MNLNLSGKRALVCGASQGLGLASAIELAKLGAEICLISRTESKLKQAKNRIDSINHLENDVIVLDLQDLDKVNATMQELSGQKNIHILINNTGGPSPGPLLKATQTEFEKAFRMHLLASDIISKALIPGMRNDGYGRIINIISTSVRQPISGLAVSNTIRGAMASWAKTLSNELAIDGITVNNVLPGTTSTERLQQLMFDWQEDIQSDQKTVEKLFLDQIPMRRFATPEEIGGVVAFLASPAASYITGASIPVDGGKIKSI